MVAENFAQGPYFGDFGGRFVAESLMGPLEEVEAAWKRLWRDKSFQRRLRDLFLNYAGRPSLLTEAPRFAADLGGVRVFLKREDLNHTGSHKINNALGQVLLARHMGRRRVIAETGAGQHGVAVATVCALMGMECMIYMGRTDTERQRANVEKIRMLGGEVTPVESGNMTLKDATNEAIREWCRHPSDTYYVIGSTVGPHPYPDLVARLQSVIGHEIRWQLQEHEGRDKPDCLMACVGGGSNAAGTIYPFVDDERVRIVLAEAAGCGVESGQSAATLHLGLPGIIHGARTLVMQDDDGQIEEPYSISAGLDYPGVGPEHSYFKDQGIVEYVSVTDEEALAAFQRLCRLEGIVPAMESSHALAYLEKLMPGTKENEVVVVCLSGRGDKDVQMVAKALGRESE